MNIGRHQVHGVGLYAEVAAPFILGAICVVRAARRFRLVMAGAAVLRWTALR